MNEIFLFAVGAVFGSFAGAVAWRLHHGRDFIRERSECEHCHHVLSAMDLIPIVGWLSLKGKCRYCRKPVSWQYPLMELCLGGLFVLSYTVWPLGFESWQAIASFSLWLVFLVLLAVLVISDLKWMLLPDKIVFPLIFLGMVDAGLRVSLQTGAGLVVYASHVTLGIISLAGIYWLLYTFSKGKWVGYGDVKLSIFIGVVLGWQKTLLVFMLANTIGFLVVAPALALKLLTRKSRVPFGPFLIAGFVIAGLFGDAIIKWYLNLLVFPAH